MLLVCDKECGAVVSTCELKDKAHMQLLPPTISRTCLAPPRPGMPHAVCTMLPAVQSSCCVDHQASRAAAAPQKSALAAVSASASATQHSKCLFLSRLRPSSSCRATARRAQETRCLWAACAARATACASRAAARQHSSAFEAQRVVRRRRCVGRPAAPQVCLLVCWLVGSGEVLHTVSIKQPSELSVMSDEALYLVQAA